ncbi:MAG: three-Cys-motif partner protein TcmP [Pyrinomonadaceae bacterium]|nr:three-Cys-motif partner protein TcmP [Pyrinomonadaceae bacterium]
MKNQEFFDKIKPWSIRKHRLLGKYLPPFSGKVAKATHNREIYCIDGFAGAAKYEDGSEGSPLLIAKFSDECAKWRNPVTLKLINVEPDVKGEGIFPLLEKATQKWVEKSIVENINKEFFSALPEIIAKTGNSPALFFIDPFGPTYVHFSHLQPILTRNQRITELIINFDTDGLRRIVDASFSEKTNPKTAETNSQNITKIIGSANWKQKLNVESLSTEECEEILLEEYKQNIKRFDYHVVAYPIRESLDKKPKYHFVYCTRHSDGIGLMNDFIREEEDLLYGEHIEEKLTLFSSSNLAHDEINRRREKLHEIMNIYLEKHQRIIRNQVIKNLIEDYFGHFHSKDYKTIFKEFIDSGMLKTTDDKTKIDDRVYFFSLAS